MCAFRISWNLLVGDTYAGEVKVDSGYGRGRAQTRMTGIDSEGDFPDMHAFIKQHFYTDHT